VFPLEPSPYRQDSAEPSETVPPLALVDSHPVPHMVEHTAGEIVAADTVAADMLAAVDTKPADMGVAVDTKPATDRESLDTVTALHLVRYTDYIDRTVRILSVAWPLVECRSHHRNVYQHHFAYHNLYRKQDRQPCSAEPPQHAYRVHIVYRT